MLQILSPATGAVIAELPQDTHESVLARYQAARAAQPAWAHTTLEHRLDCVRRFRSSLVQDIDKLAAVLTSEVGKPIKQSRSEINGLLGRIDFFLGATAATLAPRRVFDEGGMREEIS